jgi:hypothetical protein
MHLFGDHRGPHIAHFHAHRDGDHVRLEWEVRNAPALRWRVLRPEREFAATAGALPGSGQTVVLEGTDTHLADDALVRGTPYFYSVFAQDAQAVWRRHVKVKLARSERLAWLHPSVPPSQPGDPSGDHLEAGHLVGRELELETGHRGSSMPWTCEPH